MNFFADSTKLQALNDIINSNQPLTIESVGNGQCIGFKVYQTYMGYEGKELDLEDFFLLNSVKNDWSKDFELTKSTRIEWARNLNNLTKYLSSRKVPPIGLLSNNDTKIYNWLRKNSESKLTNDRENSLNSILSEWRDLSSISLTWRKSFAAVFTHYIKYGCLPRGVAFYIDKKNISRWIHTQRHTYFTKGLSPGKLLCLSSIPDWDKAEKWRGKRYLLSDTERHKVIILAKYLKTHKNTLPGVNTVYKGYPVGHWVSYFLRRHKEGTMSDILSAELSKIRGWQWMRAQNSRDLLSLRNTKSEKQTDDKDH